MSEFGLASPTCFSDATMFLQPDSGNESEVLHCAATWYQLVKILIDRCRILKMRIKYPKKGEEGDSLNIILLGIMIFLEFFCPDYMSQNRWCSYSPITRVCLYLCFLSAYSRKGLFGRKQTKSVETFILV